jgi:hypothetical protein
MDYVGVGDVGKLIALFGEALDVLSEGLVGPLSVVMEVPGVTWVGVGTLELVDEDQTEIALVADAARLELLEPSSGRA